MNNIEKIIYNCKYKILKVDNELYKLNEKEHIFLIRLSNNSIITYHELLKLFNFNKRSKLNGLKNRLLDKIRYSLTIDTIRNRGYILRDEIYFE